MIKNSNICKVLSIISMSLIITACGTTQKPISTADIETTKTIMENNDLGNNIDTSQLKDDIIEEPDNTHSKEEYDYVPNSEPLKIENDADNFTEKELEVLNTVDTEIGFLLVSKEYRDSSDEDKYCLAIKLTDELVNKGLIKEGSVLASPEEDVISFEYNVSGNVAGGIMLRNGWSVSVNGIYQ